MAEPPAGQDPNSHLIWKEQTRERVFTCPFLTVDRCVRYATAEGPHRTGDFYVLDTSEWVTVVPVLTLGNGREAFLMVRQYRHGIERITTEFPAGLAERAR